MIPSLCNHTPKSRSDQKKYAYRSKINAYRADMGGQVTYRCLEYVPAEDSIIKAQNRESKGARKKGVYKCKQSQNTRHEGHEKRITNRKWVKGTKTIRANHTRR
jgi:hypothetical protein